LTVEQRVSLDEAANGRLFACASCDSSIHWNDLDYATPINIGAGQLLDEEDRNNLYCSQFCVILAHQEYKEWRNRNCGCCEN
jgi:hypothetical protein